MKEKTKASLGAIRKHARIKADPILDEARSDALKKAAAEIKADPDRNESRSRNMSKAAIKRQAEIKADPDRAAARSEASKKAQAEIKADIDRSVARSEASSKAISRATYKLDPITLEVIQTYQSNQEAAIDMNCTPGLISQSKKFGYKAKGFRWK